MSGQRHSWGEASRPTPYKTERQCLRCGLVKVSRHEAVGSPAEAHWTEWYRPPEPTGEPGDRIEAEHTPRCEPVAEAVDG